MLTILTIAAVVIAVVLVLVHWKTVREALLWVNAIAILLALLAAVIVFIFAVINLSIDLALLSVGLLVVAGLCGAIEEWDRNSQWAKFRAYYHRVIPQDQSAEETKGDE